MGTMRQAIGRVLNGGGACSASRITSSAHVALVVILQLVSPIPARAADPGPTAPVPIEDLAPRAPFRTKGLESVAVSRTDDLEPPALSRTDDLEPPALSRTDDLEPPALSRTDDLQPLAPSAAGRGEPLTLTRAITHALARNREVQAARDAVRAGQLAVWSAGLRLAPRATLNTSVTRVDDNTYRVANAALEGLYAILDVVVPDRRFDIEPFVYRTTYRTNIVVEQPIFNGGRLWYGLEGAKAGREARALEHGAIRQRTAYQAKEAFFGHLKALALERVALRAVTSAQERLAMARASFEVGQRNRSEVLRWEVFLSGRRNELLEAQNAVATSLAALNLVMGIPLETTWSLVEDEGELRRLEQTYNDVTLEAFKARVEAGNPTLRQARVQSRLADVQRRIARGAILPSLNAQFQYGWHEDDDLALDDYNTWYAALAVSYPLDGVNVTEYGRARAEARQVKREADHYREVLMLEATQSYLEARTARDRVELQETALRLARENLSIVEDRYRAGAATLVDLLDAQVAFDETETTLVSSRYDLILALSRLELLEGAAAGSR